MKHLQLEVWQKYVHYIISDGTAIIIVDDVVRMSYLYLLPREDWKLM